MRFAAAARALLLATAVGRLAATPVPTDSPTANPTLKPTVSQMPSSQPSSEPSSQPSSDPSESPSSEPSESPSDEPSSEPSSTPSCTPSSSPTESPSTKYGVNMFYPIWEQNYNGCRNDGMEPDYMAVNPGDWLTSSIKACCEKFFAGYMYEDCMGFYPPDHDDCNKALFYPDWSGANEGCLGDGKEPYYMTANADFFLVDSLEKCCEKYYNWNYYDCTGTRPVLTNGEYYPDWAGDSSSYCLNDDKMPDYMLNNQNWYLSTTLQKCCEKHFHYEMNECMGTSYAGTNEWYVSYEDRTCYQDCSGAAPCGGVVNSWVDTFKTKEKCCKEELKWYPLKKCLID